MQRFEGRNLEDALENAAKTLGVERYQLNHQVILERRGFLGGTKKVVVEAAIAADAADRKPAASAPSLAADVGRPADAPSARKERAPRQRQERSPERSFRRRHDQEDDFEPAAPDASSVPPPDQGPASPEAVAARAWIEELVRLSGLNLVARSEDTAEQIWVRLYGPDQKNLEARDGELLDSFQVLVNKSLVREQTARQIELDCSGFKARRNTLLAGQARSAADEVRRSGKERLLPAMTPVERRIVHLTLQEESDVTTQSRGEGFLKRVAIVPRGASTLQQEP